MQKFIFHKNTTRIHREAHLGVGSCTLFVPPVHPVPPNGCVFWRFGVCPLHQKKRHPGIRGLSQGIAFCMELSVKSYWHGKNHWVCTKTENHRGFPENPKIIKFSKQPESRTTTKMHYSVSHFFKNGTPLKKHTSSRLFPGKQERLKRDWSSRTPTLKTQAT